MSRFSIPGQPTLETKRFTIEAVDASFDLLDNLFRAPEDEALARQLVEPDVEMNSLPGSTLSWPHSA